MGAEPLPLVTRDLLLPIFLKNLRLAGRCRPDVLGLFLAMLVLLYGCLGPHYVALLMREWHKALSTPLEHVLNS